MQRIYLLVISTKLSAKRTLRNHLNAKIFLFIQWRIQGRGPPTPYFWTKLRPVGNEKLNLQRLTGYELAGNEILLRQLKCSIGKMERYKMDAYHVRKHSRLAHVIFYVFFLVYI